MMKALDEYLAPNGMTYQQHKDRLVDNLLGGIGLLLLGKGAVSGYSYHHPPPAYSERLASEDPNMPEPWWLARMRQERASDRVRMFVEPAAGLGMLALRAKRMRDQAQARRHKVRRHKASTRRR